MLIADVLIAAAVWAAPAGAQVFQRGGNTTPVLWMSAGVGFLNPRAVSDGATESSWDFGDAVQYRGSLALPVGRAYSLGVVGTWSRMPLHYRPLTGGDGPDAHARIWSALATFHAGGGAGLHQVLELEAGVVGFDDFAVDATEEPLPPRSANTDLALGVAWGFGYSFNARTEIQLVQDYTWVFHEREGPAEDASRTARQSTLRFGLRFGLGTHHTGF